MQLGVKLGAGLAAVVLAGSTLGGTAAAAPQPEPQPAGSGQDGAGATEPRPTEEEGHGPGAIEVGPEGAAQALERLQQRSDQRARWCYGRVLPQNGLNVREGPGLRHDVKYALGHNARVATNWSSIQRRDGYLWVKLRHSRYWIADYKIGHGNGKWYVKYRNC